MTLGSFVAVDTILGDLPLQNHTFEAEGILLEHRHVTYAVRLLARQTRPGQLGAYVHDPATRGDITAGICWPNIPTKRARPAWRYGAFPAVAMTGSSDSGVLSALPVYDEEFTPDDRFERVDVTMPPGVVVSAGTPLLVLDAQREDAQIPIGFPIGAGPLVSQWRGLERPLSSTRVYDCKIDPLLAGVLDPLMSARLDTVWRVTDGQLAWALTRPPLAAGDAPGTPVGGYGLCVGKPAPRDGVSGFPGLLYAAAASWELGGPLVPGAYLDRHILGTTSDGLALMPLHISSEALFLVPGTSSDGPLHFSGVEPGDGPVFDVKTPVRLTFDAAFEGGKFRWWVKVPFQPAAGGAGGASGAGAAGLEFHNALGMPACYGRPVLSWFPGEDLRFRNETGGQAAQQARTTPVTWWGETFGLIASDGRSFQTAARGGLSERLRGRTGPGGFLFGPPEFDANSLRYEYLQTEADATFSDTWFAVVRARVSLTEYWSEGVGPVDGGYLERSSVGGLRISGVDETGVDDSARVLEAAMVLQTSSGHIVKRQRSAATPITLSTQQFVVLSNSTAGATVVNMPASAQDGTLYVIKNVGAGGNTATLTPAGGDTVNGAATLALNDGQVRWVCYDEDAQDWVVIACC